MEVKLQFGIDKLLFGMDMRTVENIYGKPDVSYKDEDKNDIWTYNHIKLRLTFYFDEELKLGYIVSANPELDLFGKKIIGEPTRAIIDFLYKNKIVGWEQTMDDGKTIYFNETNWLLLHSEFEEITKIEIGAMLNYETDEFYWKI
jgi:hypothetical protein